MLKFQTPQVVPKVHNVNVRFYPASSTKDMMDFIRPVRWLKPNSIIIHYETNDLTKGINTMKQVRKMAKAIK